MLTRALAVLAMVVGCVEPAPTEPAASTWEPTFTPTLPARLDSDQDGLVDEAEAVAGTDPADPDSDRDGLSDGLEVAEGLDPLAADSDGDGLPDGEEWVQGTDPRSADTDGDGLGDGDELPTTSPTDADTDDDGLLDGEEAALGTQPDLADTDNDGLDDGEELRLGTVPFDPDTDSDGLRDGAEVDAGTNPWFGDTDRDGLLDGEEEAYGADPLEPDSDGDGLADGVELYLHSCDPVRTDSDGDGLDDGDEVSAGSDPALQDTDGGGLGDGAEVLAGGDPLDPADDGAPCAGVIDCAGLCTTDPVGVGACSTRFDCATWSFDDGVCPTVGRVINGDVSVSDVLGLASLGGVEAIRGTLTLDLGTPPEVVLPRLERVGSLRTPARGRIQTLSMPALEEAEVMELVDERLTHLDLGSLVQVGELILDEAGDLPRLDLPSLVEINALEVDMARLRQIRAPGVTRLDTLEVRGASLRFAELTALTEVGSLTWTAGGMPALPQLTTAGEVELDGVIGVVSLPALTHADALSWSGTRIVDVHLDALRTVGELRMDQAVGPEVLQLEVETVDTLMVDSVSHRMLSLPALSALDELEIFGAVRLQQVELPHARDVRRLRLDSLTEMTDVSWVWSALAPGAALNLLRMPVAGSLVVPRLDLARIGLTDLALETVELPSGGTLTGVLALRDHAHLQDVRWVDWSLEGELLVEGNPVLTTLSVPSSWSPASVVSIDGNDQLDACGWSALGGVGAWVVQNNLPCP